MRERFVQIATGLALATLAGIAGCGDDDAVFTPTPCPGDICASYTVNASQWTFLSNYDSFSDDTFFFGFADFRDSEITVSPGDRVLLRISLDPPLVVTDNIPQSLAAFMRARPRGAYSTNGFADALNNRSQLFTSVGEFDAVVRVAGIQTALLDFSTSWSIANAEEGDRISQVVIDFTVPDRYTSGGLSGNAIPTDSPLLVGVFNWSATLDGDRRGETPPLVLDED